MLHEDKFTLHVFVVLTHLSWCPVIYSTNNLELRSTEISRIVESINSTCDAYDVLKYHKTDENMFVTVFL